MKKYTVEFVGTRTFLVANEKSLDSVVTQTLNVLPQNLNARAKVIKVEDQ